MATTTKTLVDLYDKLRGKYFDALSGLALAERRLTVATPANRDEVKALIAALREHMEFLQECSHALMLLPDQSTAAEGPRLRLGGDIEVIAEVVIEHGTVKTRAPAPRLNISAAVPPLTSAELDELEKRLSGEGPDCNQPQTLAYSLLALRQLRAAQGSDLELRGALRRARTFVQGAAKIGNSYAAACLNDIDAALGLDAPEKAERFIPHGQRCEADDGRGSDFGRCSQMARGMVTHEGRDRYVCDFHLKHHADGGGSDARPKEVLRNKVLPTVAGRMERTIADLERACLIHLAEEQARANPDNALIAVLCDAVRFVREQVQYGRL